MFTLSFFDLTTGARTNFPMLPVDGQFGLEHPMNFNESPILGSKPNVQITATGSKVMTMQLDLWGVDGDAFYKEWIEPAYGLTDFQPHLIQIAWGSSADAAFSGYPIGMPSTQVTMGENTGEIFSRTFDYTLREIQNQRPSVVNVATNQLVTPATKTHTIKSGDDLLSLSKLYGVSVATIAELNPGLSYEPAVGSRLVLPK